jgi:hypothetical protein
MNQTIKIKSSKEANGWANIVTIEGKEISIKLDANPKLSQLITSNATELFGNVVEKNGKTFMWDASENKSPFAKKTPEELEAKKQREDLTQRMIIAQNSMTNATNYYAQRTSGSYNDIEAMASRMFDWVINKANGTETKQTKNDGLPF